MKHDHSYGVIPLKLENDQFQVLLVQQHAGHWGFPKGHPHVGETPQVAAERELEEETGLILTRYLPIDPLVETYQFFFNGQLIHKTVDYFVAFVEGIVVHQECEIKNSQWLTFDEAIEQMTFEEGKNVCRKVYQLIQNQSSV